MVWLYVVTGLIIIIAVLILMNMERSKKKVRTESLNVSYICMRCGHSFKGSKCPNCGFERKPVEFGK